MPTVQGGTVGHLELQRETFAVRFLMAQDTQDAGVGQLASLFSFRDITFVEPDNKITGVIEPYVIRRIVNQHIKTVI